MTSTRPPKLKPGQKFNRLTIISFHHSDKRWRKHYLCKCECGTERVIQGSLMASGNTKSCGCLSTEVRKSTRVSKNHTEITAIVLGYKRHARGRGFDFELTRTEVESIIKNKCHYCGCEPSNLKITKDSIDGGLYYNGIDRLNSKNNYTLDNVVPCCCFCNRAKNDKSKEYFLKWIKRVYDHQAMVEQWGTADEL
ncbi:MAG: hypothetical protein GQ576_04785 [Methanococcoides sp.]|nr:hypothetical protein [Methanococcoides sp.]